MLPPIFDILVRFRLGKIGIVADIKKAFLQIAIDEDQRYFLRIIWYKNVFAQNPTVKILRFARLVFGLTLSTFINTFYKNISSKHEIVSVLVLSCVNA